MLPVVRAWREIGGDPSAFSMVEVRKETKGSQVYRLRGTDPPIDVIAKRRKIERLAPERIVYERLLPWVSPEPVRYFGSHDDPETGFGWLFIEHLEGVPFNAADGNHVATLADFLAEIHGKAASHPEIDALPNRDLTFFREQAEAAGAAIRGGFDNPTIRHTDREMLTRHLELLDDTLDLLPTIFDGPAGNSRTLVHCDVIPSNSRIVSRRGADRLVMFDWEYCGVGSAASDLAALAKDDVALHRYAERLEEWRAVSHEDVRRLAELGIVLRFIFASTWAGSTLQHPYPHRGLRRLGRYQDDFRAAILQVAATVGA